MKSQCVYRSLQRLIQYALCKYLHPAKQYSRFVICKVGVYGFPNRFNRAGDTYLSQTIGRILKILKRFEYRTFKGDILNTAERFQHSKSKLQQINRL